MQRGGNGERRYDHTQSHTYARTKSMQDWPDLGQLHHRRRTFKKTRREGSCNFFDTQLQISDKWHYGCSKYKFCFYFSQYVVFSTHFCIFDENFSIIRFSDKSPTAENLRGSQSLPRLCRATRLYHKATADKTIHIMTKKALRTSELQFSFIFCHFEMPNCNWSSKSLCSTAKVELHE